MKLLWIILAVLISACSSKPPLTMYKNDEQMVLKDSFVDFTRSQRPRWECR
jgi:uncharacterized lipoprotein YmbA